MTNKIAIRNLPTDTSTREVSTLAGKYGQVKSVVFKGTGRDRVAYVEMADDRQAGTAITKLQGYTIGRNSLNVNEA